MDLKTYLSQRDQTYTDFAKEIGVTSMAVSRYVRRERRPRGKVLAKIIEVTDGKVRSGDFYEAA